MKSIYIDVKVEQVITKLKSELATTYEEEAWDEHFYRISEETKKTIALIKEISTSELHIKT